jgi:hypothetical protein
LIRTSRGSPLRRAHRALEEASIAGGGRGPATAATARAGEGVQVVASGPKGSIARRRGDIVAMIRSLRAAS